MATRKTRFVFIAIFFLSNMYFMAGCCPTVPDFSGEWYSDDYGYGFEIEITDPPLLPIYGYMTYTNAPEHYLPGDPILIITEIEGVTFTGSQMFNNGVFYAVTGTINCEENSINMIGGGFNWNMRKVLE